jgi:hypothetical protein
MDGYSKLHSAEGSSEGGKLLFSTHLGLCRALVCGSTILNIAMYIIFFFSTGLGLAYDYCAEDSEVMA